MLTDGEQMLIENVREIYELKIVVQTCMDEGKRNKIHVNPLVYIYIC